MPKNAEKFYCEKCDFICCKKSNYDAHILTSKHQNRTTLNDFMPKNAVLFACRNCEKTYKARNSLWYHEQKCCNQNKINNDNKNLVDYLIKENSEFKDMILEQNKVIAKICENTNTTIYNNSNNNNKTFNLQLFLNETCKDAMNINDFVNSIKLQLTDLENIGENGYVDGISNIIVKKLKVLDVTQRPIHCTDSKREILYVKDENKWEKENKENNKLRKVIKQVAHKNTGLLKDFRDKHPDYGKSESKHSDHYNKLIIEAMGGKGDNELDKEDKIIKKIAKEVIIDK
jgi:hypothetical protein